MMRRSDEGASVDLTRSYGGDIYELSRSLRRGSKTGLWRNIGFISAAITRIAIENYRHSTTPRLTILVLDDGGMRVQTTDTPIWSRPIPRELQ